MAEPVYRRVVIKLSGEYLAGSHSFGIDQPTVDRIADELIAAQKLGGEIAVVVGGGNMIRGVDVSSRGVPRPTGDTMGMLVTVTNCLALEAAIERKGTSARTCNKLLGRTGNAFWMEDSYNRIVRDGRELRAVREYIRNNPVKAGLVDVKERWPWSSVRRKADDKNRSSAPQSFTIALDNLRYK